MRTLVLIVGVLITSAVMATTTQSAYADSGQSQNSEDSASEEAFSTIYSSQKSSVYLALLENEDEEDIAEDEATELEPIVYKVERGDTLIKIAKNHETEWLRLWQRNEELEHPDKIHPGDEIVIPFADEELEERELPEPEVVEQLDAIEETAVAQATAIREAPATTQPAQQQERATQPRTQVGSSAGNLYAPGYCTWHVKNRRGDLPNNLGNANMWVSRASSQGMSTGSTPRAGAVAYQPASSLGHVAYVEAVHNDGTVTVSEMNWNGWNVTSQRRVPASTFTAYIY